MDHSLHHLPDLRSGSHPSSRKFAEQQPHLRSGLRRLVNTQQAADESYSAPGLRLPFGRAAAALVAAAATGHGTAASPLSMAQQRSQLHCVCACCTSSTNFGLG